MEHGVEPERIAKLKDGTPREERDYVLYWMQSSMRAEDNCALEYAVGWANALDKRLLVAFALTADYPDANARHYAFLLQGLADVDEALRARGIKFVVQLGNPPAVIARLAKRAAMLVVDRGYVRVQVAWRREVRGAVDCPMHQVESELVVPLETASDKAEYAARTLRPKIEGERERFIRALPEHDVSLDAANLSVQSEAVDGPVKRARLLRELGVDESVEPIEGWQGGTREAKRLFEAFLDDDLDDYESRRTAPERPAVSRLSPYLHFGQISPVWVAHRVQRLRRSPDQRAAFLEELLVRRELAHNFVAFTSDYDSFTCLPSWARETLEQHADDEREHHYTRQQLEDAETHDPYWNAAMLEMRHSGYLHNHLRMYWGKQILAWCNTPQFAYRTCLELNNRYFLDGRDANSFANVGWVFGLHDRAWQERPVFGKVRTMTQAGLERKIDGPAYLASVQRVLDDQGVDRRVVDA